MNTLNNTVSSLVLLRPSEETNYKDSSTDGTLEEDNGKEESVLHCNWVPNDPSFLQFLTSAKDHCLPNPNYLQVRQTEITPTIRAMLYE